MVVFEKTLGQPNDGFLFRPMEDDGGKPMAVSSHPSTSRTMTHSTAAKEAMSEERRQLLSDIEVFPSLMCIFTHYPQ